MTATPRVIAERFEVVRVLGEGASARTFLCRDLRNDRDVAVKELHVAHLDNWKRLELFEREAKVLAALRHHAVPQVYESFEQEDGGRVNLVLVQEYIAGDSLSARMESGPSLGQVELVQLTLGILDVLEYLHGRSPPVYHRDIKPSNIIVRPNGAPVLVDFGSVTNGWRPPGATGSTVTGTFGYMPPEQLLGQVGPTSDLYALGATLLHVITTRSPTEFPFDSGRIEVPEDLPASDAMRRLLVALLEPAPRKRPASVGEARALLLGEAVAPSTALTLVPEAPALIGGDGPKAADVGPAPRDPQGPHASTYRVLVDPLNLVQRGASRIGRFGRTVGVSMLSLVTVGIYPLAYYADRASRRRKYDEVFRNGTRTHGTIVEFKGSIKTDIYVSIGYEFMAGAVKHRSFISYPVGMVKYLAVGDRVAVLYLESDPTRACIVFRA